MTDTARLSLGKTPPTRKVGIACLAALVGLLALLALAACGASTAQVKASPTPDAKALLQQSGKASFKDFTFTMTFNMTVTTQGQSLLLNGTGSGKATNSPQRYEMQMAFPLTAAGHTYQISMEMVGDSATKTGYMKTSGVPGQPTKWSKMSLAKLSSSGGVDFSGIEDTSNFQNVRFIGADTVNGVAVWHIQADLPAASATTTPTSKTPTVTATATSASSGTADIYLSQDSDRLMKFTEHMTGETSGDVTITITQYDSGATITLPKV